MKSFGLGTLATVSSKERYGGFLTSLHAVYDTMERTLDGAAATPANSIAGGCWNAHADVLRREGKIRRDLAQVGVAAPRDWAGVEDVKLLTPATREYVARVSLAAEEDGRDGGGRMLGHLYCRYFADLFGGQALKSPTRLALALEEGTPTMYDFNFEEGERGAYIESLYVSLNEAGEALGEDGRKKVEDEALECFRLNKELYLEGGIYGDAWRGSLNIVKGAIFELKPESLKGYGRRKM